MLKHVDIEHHPDRDVHGHTDSLHVFDWEDFIWHVRVHYGDVPVEATLPEPADCDYGGSRGFVGFDLGPTI